MYFPQAQCPFAANDLSAIGRMGRPLWRFVADSAQRRNKLRVLGPMKSVGRAHDQFVGWDERRFHTHSGHPGRANSSGLGFFADGQTQESGLRQEDRLRCCATPPTGVAARGEPRRSDLLFTPDALQGLYECLGGGSPVEIDPSQDSSRLSSQPSLAGYPYGRETFYHIWHSNSAAN